MITTRHKRATHQCSKCRLIKPRSEFHRKGDRLQAYCKRCHRAEWRARNPKRKARYPGREYRSAYLKPAAPGSEFSALAQSFYLRRV